MSGGTWAGFGGSGGTWWRSPGWPTPHWIIDNGSQITGAHYKVSEMCMPSSVPPARLFNNGKSNSLGYLAQRTPQSAAAQRVAQVAGPVINTSSVGAPGTTPLVPGMINPSHQMVFTDANGNAVNQVVCGSVYSMNIPGLEGTNVYLVQTKDGNPQFSGQFAIPMSNYQSLCPQDQGVYQASAFSLVDGSPIASTTFTVLPQGSAGGTGVATTAPVPGATTATGATISSVFDTITSSEWLLIGGGLLLVYMLRRGQ